MLQSSHNDSSTSSGSSGGGGGCSGTIKFHSNSTVTETYTENIFIEHKLYELAYNKLYLN